MYCVPKLPLQHLGLKILEELDSFILQYLYIHNVPHKRLLPYQINVEVYLSSYGQDRNGKNGTKLFLSSTSITAHSPSPSLFPSNHLHSLSSLKLQRHSREIQPCQSQNIVPKTGKYCFPEVFSGSRRTLWNSQIVHDQIIVIVGWNHFHNFQCIELLFMNLRVSSLVIWIS